MDCVWRGALLHKSPDRPLLLCASYLNRDPLAKPFGRVGEAQRWRNQTVLATRSLGSKALAHVSQACFLQ